jgi:hypothetical protein
MLKDEIIVGKSYVNEDAHVLREVVEEIDSRRIKFNAFNLDTGQLLPSPNQVCRKSQLARWANRGARPREIARVHPYDQSTWFEGLPPGEQVGAQLERAKASMEQMAGNRTFHKW